METNHRKVGRPKAPPRTGPLVLEENHGRTKVTLEISNAAASELAEYSEWVEQCSGITAGEAKFKTADFALREIFRRDRVWQAKRRTAPKPAPANPATAAAPSPAVRPVATTPPSLPPPAPRDARPTLDGSRV